MACPDLHMYIVHSFTQILNTDCTHGIFMQILTLIAHMCLCMPMSLCLSMAEMSSLHNILSHVLEQTYSFVVHNSTTNLGSATCSTCRPVRQGKVCLLYTSPSPRDATLSRMPSSA